MKIVTEEIDLDIALAFCFRNSEPEIPRALKPWVDKVDHFIAVDGLFKLPYSPKMIENALTDETLRTVYSTDNSKQLLKDLCGDKLWYETIYATQNEKRQLAMDVAGKMGADVLIVWDTDEYIHPDYADFDKFFRNIAKVVNNNHGQEDLYWMTAWIPDEEKWPRQYNKVADNTWKRYTRIHHIPKNHKYVLNHYTFTHKNVKEEDIIRFALEHGTEVENPYLNYPHITVDGVRIAMDRDLRNPVKNEYGNGWTWQLLHEEKYRIWLQEMKVMGHTKVVERDTRKLGTYYFNEHGQMTPYDEELQDKFNKLGL
jgi:hypothetical protein